MNIVKKKINDLLLAEYNPRKDLQPGDEEYQKIKNSIEKFGYVQPIILNKKNNVVVGGNQRLKVLKELGYTDVECVIVDLDSGSEKALNVALNKIDGIWDEEKLKNLMNNLHEVEFDLNFTGFNSSELNEILENNSSVSDDGFDEDEAIKEITDVKTKLGNFYQLGNHYLICGDCKDENLVSKLLGTLKVDCLVTDPPYGVDYAGKNKFLNKKQKGNRIQREIKNDNIENYKEFFTDFLKVIPFNNYNTCYVAMSGIELHNLRLAFDNANINFGDYLVWVKNNHVLGRKDYSSKHEFFVYGWKGKHKFYGNFSTTVLEYNKPTKNDLHPTMKPVELIARLITDGSKQESIIYDPFGGSGTSLIASEQTNRKCFMFELEPLYCDVIINRYIKHKENSEDIFLINDGQKIKWKNYIKE